MPSLFKFIRQTYNMVHPHDGRVVLNNVASLSVLQVITYLLPIIIIPYLFRVIGPDKFGLIAFAQALTQYFVILTNYGFNVSATKEISLCRNDHAKVCQAFSSVMIVKSALTLLSLLLLGAIVYFVPKFRNDWPVYVLSFGTVLGNTFFPIWYFQGTEQMKYITKLNIIVGIASALLILFFVKSAQDFLLVPLINSGAFIIVGLWGQCIVFNKFKVSFKFPGISEIRRQLQAGWDVFISVAAINAYTTTRVFVLGLLTNNNITGFYSVAERIANACQTFPLDSFSQAIFPRLSKIYRRNKLKALKLMRQIQQITVIISLMTLPVIAFFADQIVKVACGGIYPETVLTFRVLLIAVFFISANSFRVQFLLVCGKTKIYSQIHVVMATLGLPLIFLLTDAFSYTGVALATVIIEAGVFTVTFFTVKALFPPTAE